MDKRVEKAVADLYGKDGIGATNVKIFLGSNRDVTAGDVAEQLSGVVEELKDGSACVRTLREDQDGESPVLPGKDLP